MDHCKILNYYYSIFNGIGNNCMTSNKDSDNGFTLGCITQPQLFSGASTGLLGKGKLMPMPPWYATIYISFVCALLLLFAFCFAIVCNYIIPLSTHLLPTHGVIVLLCPFPHSAFSGCRWYWRDIFPWLASELNLYFPRIWIYKKNLKWVRQKTLTSFQKIYSNNLLELLAI
jgi:hypothetical protein